MLELELEAQRSRELLRRCGVREDELSKARSTGICAP